MAKLAQATTRLSSWSHPLPELSRVVITSPARTIEGDQVASGTEGTIVFVWEDGEAYEIEFAQALGPATVEAKDLVPIRD